MKKMVCLIVLLICLPVQATLGDAVDFVTKVTQEYSKEKPEQRKKLVVTKNDMHPAKKLGLEFAKGLSKALVPGVLYVAHQAGGKLYHNGSVTFPKILKVTEQITLLGVGIGIGDVMSIAGALIRSDNVSLFDILQGLAHVAGSATAVALLVALTGRK